MEDALLENYLIGKWSNWKKPAVMPDVRREKKSVFSEQREWWAEDKFHPLQQRPNDKKFKHENWWGWLGFNQIAVRSQIVSLCPQLTRHRSSVLFLFIPCHIRFTTIFSILICMLMLQITYTTWPALLAMAFFRQITRLCIVRLVGLLSIPQLNAWKWRLSSFAAGNFES